MQPGNAPKARPSHLTTADVALKSRSKGLAFEDRQGRVLRRMQTLNWDTAIVNTSLYKTGFRTWVVTWLCPTSQCRSGGGRWTPAARRSPRRAHWTSRWQTAAGGGAARCWSAPRRPRTNASRCDHHGSLGVNTGHQNELRLRADQFHYECCL